MFGSGGMNLITTIIGFGMSATFIVFVCTRLICGRFRGVESRQMFEIDSGIDLEQVLNLFREYQEKEVLRIMPKCGHSFHLSCIDVWLRKQSTCPVCRLPIKESLDTKHLRRAVSEITHTAGSSEVSVDRSQQWILQGAERSVGNGSNQGLTEPSPRSQGPSPPVEAETR